MIRGGGIKNFNNHKHLYDEKSNTNGNTLTYSANNEIFYNISVDTKGNLRTVYIMAIKKDLSGWYVLKNLGKVNGIKHFKGLIKMPNDYPLFRFDALRSDNTTFFYVNGDIYYN